jgi:transcriptional regulator with XRE-family HTH domain
LTVGNFVSGTVVNPITDARLTMSMSGPALAKRLGLSRQYLNRAEQGTYTSLNPALVRWVSNALNISPGAVSDRYGKFQAATRRETVQKFNPHKLERHESSEPGGTIFERWRSGYWTSHTQFATAFCVHPDTVQKYEEGVQKKMPKDIFRALTQVNLIDADWSDEKQSDETGAQRARL